MRCHLASWFLMLIVCLPFAPARALDLGRTPPIKELSGEPYPGGGRSGGETIEDAIPVGMLPFYAQASTCGYADDYDAVCPYTGSTAPDVVYSYACTASTYLTIDLCNSTYDTKVYVYEDAVGTPIACNDDYCSWQSFLMNVPVASGHTYYIVVDGYGTSCGEYYLDMSIISSTGYFECPPEAMLEGEPDCYDNYNDTYNGGCNVAPSPVFQMIEPSEDPIVICGTTGVFNYDTILYRDTDWYQLDLTEPKEICLAGDAQVPCYFFIIDGRSGCDGSTIMAYDTVGPYSPMEGLCYNCDAGTWWMWAGPNAWDLSFWCGALYWMEITGYTCGSPSPTTDTTWGSVKGLFR